MKTQNTRILEFMRKWGGITQMIGYQRLGITCTSQRITDIRKTHNVLTRYEISPTGARYAIWSLGRAKK